MERRWLALAGLIGVGGLVAGCGSSPNCATVATLGVSPAMGTAVAADAAPGNEVQFEALSGETLVDPHAACALPAVEAVVQASWTSADPVHVSISSVADATNGLAVCHGATAGAVTVTATTGTGVAVKTVTAQLTCQ